MKTQLNLNALKIFSALAILLFACSASFGQSKTEKLDELLNMYSDYGKFNGSVLVAENGKIIYEKGFGMADMEWNIPNNPLTKHRLGSVTKQFTAMIIMQLVEQGKLKLDVPISTYLPDYPKPNGDKITIHQLLTHTSGTPNFTSFPNYMSEISINQYPAEELIKIFSASPLDFEPGTRYSYSNSGYFLLGVIIEKVTGKPYEEVLHDQILTPLKMNNSGYDHHETILENRASGYQKRGNQLINAPYINMSVPFSAGAMYSTVEDLYLWDQALYTHQLLSEDNMKLMFSKHIPSGGQSYYGYGWGLYKTPIGSSADSIDVIAHTGSINGFTSIIERIPADRNLIVLLNNTGGAPLIEMSTAIAGILYNKEYKFPKRSLATLLMQTINEDGIEAGLKTFEKNKGSEDYELSEGEMNNIGYQVMSAGKIKEAIEVFKLNVKEFPKSSNVYDSLGEAYMNDGNKEEAIENYKKSVEINPANQNGIDMLAKLGVDTSSLTKEVTVDDKILEDYVGKYELAPGFNLTVRKDGKQMMTQATGQSEFPIFPKSDNVFYLKVVEAQLTFNRNSDGVVDSVTLLQGGQEITGKKLEE